jgi:cytochrome c biogenesis protein CcmG/thiol:disulfide interchange protein DsbE
MWLLPLLLFAALLALMAGNLGKPTQAVVTSKMIGKPVPAFAFEGLDGAPGLASGDLAGGGPVLVNIFASWCLPCAVEAPQLQALASKGAIVHGIAIRDTAENVRGFLAKHGNPFARIGMDTAGRVMLDLGASGVPETYVIDGRGIIRFQHVGEIRAEHVPMLLAELEKAR